MMHDLLIYGIGGNTGRHDGNLEVVSVDHFLPSGWRMVPVAEIASRERQGIMTGPFGAQLGTEDFVEDGVPVLRIGNVQWGHLNLNDLQHVSAKKADTLSRYRVIVGDLLFARSGATTGRNALATAEVAGWLINYHIIRVSVDSKQCDSRYLHACFNSELLQRQVNQEKGKGTREGINTQAIAGFRFALPPLEEQKAISDRLGSLDERLAREKHYASKLRLLKIGLMQDLLIGKVRVKVDESEEVATDG
jgi:restriction endonuclease S subunit